MNKSSKSIPDQAAMAAYIQAYMTDPKWTNIFGDRMKNFLSADAAYIQTSLTCVAVNVLAAISTVLGPHTSVKLKDDHYIKTNIYQILVASSGSGKSQAFKTFFMKPIEHVQDKEKVQLILEEFTPAGFLRFMEENKGFGVFASDEFSQIMKAAMGSRHKEDLAFR